MYVYMCAYVYLHNIHSVDRYTKLPGIERPSLNKYPFSRDFADDGEHPLAEVKVYYTRLAEPIQNCGLLALAMGRHLKQ